MFWRDVVSTRDSWPFLSVSLRCVGGFQIELEDKACDFVVDEAYDPAFGVRPLRRFIEREIVTGPLAVLAALPSTRVD